jgi:GDP-L-fucose synthase
LVKKKAKVTVPSLTANPIFLKAIKNKIKIVKADLKNQKAASNLTQNQDLCFHLAAHVGGIHYNNAHPASLLYENLLPTINLIESARLNKVKRLLIVSSACVYPRFCTIPTPESEGFLDHPEPTNFGYGWSKRVAELLALTYVQEHKMKIGIVRPYNVYGPRDNFGPKQSHVIPALVKRVCDGEDPLVVWGDGSPTRSFIYVTDIVRGMLTALQKYPQPDPINLGTTEEISIKNLSKLIIKLSGTSTKIKFDTKKPNGQPRRNCDTKKAKKILNFKSKVKLAQGLPKVINYYKHDVQEKN